MSTTVTVEGTFASAQTTYSFTYLINGVPAELEGNVYTLEMTAGGNITFLLTATVGGNRMSWASSPFSWVSGQEPPNSSSWAVTSVDDYNFTLDDPYQNLNAYSFHLQVNDGSGTVKQSTDPTIYNAATSGTGNSQEP